MADPKTGRNDQPRDEERTLQKRKWYWHGWADACWDRQPPEIPQGHRADYRAGYRDYREAPHE